MTVCAIALVGLAVFAGAAAQRLTGLGFGLVSSPFLVLVLGPFEGVVLSNVLSVVTSLGILATVWREVDPRRTAWLTAPALVAVLPGAWLAAHASAALLAVVIGSIVAVALLTVLLIRQARVFRGPVGTASAGALSGFMGVTAGVGGPAITLHAISTGWAGPRFLASVQLQFALVGIAAVAAKGLPPSGAGVLGASAVGLGAGIVLGGVLAPVLAARRVYRLVVGVAVVGALVTIAKGAASL